MGVNGVYGLSGSGLDIESLVKVGMTSKQNEYDRMYKKEVSNTWLKESYNEVYNDLYKYKNTTLYDYKLQSYMNAMSATSSDESLVTATANGAAGSMTHKVHVDSLATNAYLLTKDTVQREGSTKGSIYLRDVMFAGLEVKAGDEDTYIVTKNHDYTVADGVAFKQEGEADYTTYSSISYDSENKQYTLKTSDTDPGITISEEDFEKGTFKLAKIDSSGSPDPTETVEVSAANVKISDDGTTLTAATQTEEVDKNDTAVCLKMSDGTNNTVVTYTYKDLLEGGGKTLYDLATDSAKSTNITAKYDAATDSFSFYNKNGGEENTIAITALAADAEGKTKATAESAKNTALLFNQLHLAESDGESLSDIKTFAAGVEDVTEGENGVVTIDGKTYDNLTGNKTTVAGVTYTFSDEMAVGETVTVSVTQDTDTIIERVQKFVDDYNEILDGLVEKYNEEKYSDYTPLTKSQEEAMTESQIEKWNEKAKSGLLYHDNNLRTIISELREAIYTPIDSISSVYNCASAIGISSSTNQGHLELDTDKLKEALAADPDCVYNIFTTYEEEQVKVLNEETGEYEYKSNGNNVFSGTGLAWRLNDVMTKSISTVSSYAGTTADTGDESYLGTLITNLQTKMSNFKTMMDAYEEQLYEKYDNLETTIMKLSTQLSTVTGASSQG